MYYFACAGSTAAFLILSTVAYRYERIVHRQSITPSDKSLVECLRECILVREGWLTLPGWFSNLVCDFVPYLCTH